MTDKFQMMEVVRVRGEFRTPKTDTPPNELIDPTSVTLTIQSPDKTVEVRVYGVDDIDRDSLGKYSAPVLLDQEGTYHWRWAVSSGASVAGIASGLFDSRRETTF
jgi:hypothetical protein